MTIKHNLQLLMLGSYIFLPSLQSVTAETHYSHSSVPPVKIYFGRGINTGPYSSPEEACSAEMPGEYGSGGNVKIVHTNPSAKAGGFCNYLVEHWYPTFDGTDSYYLRYTVNTDAQNWWSVGEVCPEGYDFKSPKTGECIAARMSNASDCSGGKPGTVGNPVDTGTGRKIQIETDFSSVHGPISFDFVREYSSGAAFKTKKIISEGWFIRDFDNQLIFKSTDIYGRNNNYVYALREGGGLEVFGFKDGYWESQNTPGTLIVKDQNPVSDLLQWKYSDGVKNKNEYYDDSGVLQLIEYLDTTYFIELIYSDENTEPAIATEPGLLIEIKLSPANVAFHLTYGENSELASVLTPTNRLIKYVYSEGEYASRLLSKVMYTDDQTRQYHYEPEYGPISSGELSKAWLSSYKDSQGGFGWGAASEAPYDSSQAIADTASAIIAENSPQPLTGITDERGIRFATWKYDSRGRVISSEHSGNTDKYLFDYGESSVVGTSSHSLSIINPLGKTTEYKFAYKSGARRVESVNGLETDSCAAASKSNAYGQQGLISSSEDWRGNFSTYEYNDRKLQISKTEAFGTPQARTIQTEWHPNFSKPIKIIEPERTTEYTYDTQGRLLNSKVTPTP